MAEGHRRAGVIYTDMLGSDWKDDSLGFAEELEHHLRAMGDDLLKR